MLIRKDGKIVWDLPIEEVRGAISDHIWNEGRSGNVFQGTVIYRSFGEYKNYVFLKKDTALHYSNYRTKTAIFGGDYVIYGKRRV